jgi:hypothetical protein
LHSVRDPGIKPLISVRDSDSRLPSSIRDDGGGNYSLAFVS